MTKEEIKEEVKKVIVPLCFNEATLDWEVVGSPRVLIEVIKKLTRENKKSRAGFQIFSRGKFWARF